MKADARLLHDVRPNPVTLRSFFDDMKHLGREVLSARGVRTARVVLERPELRGLALRLPAVDEGLLALWALPAIFLTALSFAALGLIITALAPSYDFFMYYFTLFITPMTLISGVFFPTDQLPGWLATIGGCLPLAQGVALVRPLLAGQVPADALIHIMALLATTGVAFAIALRLTRRRLLK